MRCTASYATLCTCTQYCKLSRTRTLLGRRLHWPNPALTVFEVDTGAVEQVKQRTLRHFQLRAR